MMAAGLDDPADYGADVFDNLGSLTLTRQQDMRLLVHFARRVSRASRTQLHSMVVSHGTFPPTCGAVIGPFETEDYEPWAAMLSRWAEHFLEEVDFR